MTESADRQLYRRAVHKAMFLLTTLPVLVPVFAVEAALWGVSFAATHLFVNALLSWVLVEVALLRFDKIPFTCSYLPGKANLPYSAGLYFAAFATYSTAMATAGFHALTKPGPQPLIVLVSILAALAFGIPWAYRQWTEEDGPPGQLVFDDEPDSGVTVLRLTQ
jgi:hypothetical protein